MAGFPHCVVQIGLRGGGGGGGGIYGGYFCKLYHLEHQVCHTSLDITPDTVHQQYSIKSKLKSHFPYHIHVYMYIISPG